jgi:predicted dehydrogenase
MEMPKMNTQKRLRLGLSGCGSFSVVDASAVKKSQMAELITCFDVAPENRRRCSEKFGCDQEQSYEDLVKRGDIDGVLLVSPNAVHREQAVLAAQHGKHVFVEKPIANTMDDGKKMIESCQKAGVVLMVGHYLRRNAGIRKVKELIEGGAIGKPVMVEANASSRQGFELTPNQFRWYGNDSGCPGGALLTIGIHYVDVFNYLFGPIKSVFATFNKLYIPAEVEDVATTVCQFESGILGYLGSSFVSPRTHRLSIYGTEANLLWTIPVRDLSFDEAHEVMVKKVPPTQLILFEKGKESREIPLTPVDPYVEEIEEFARCCQTGEKPETDGEGGLINLAFIRAAIESSRIEKPVKIEIRRNLSGS